MMSVNDYIALLNNSSTLYTLSLDSDKASISKRKKDKISPEEQFAGTELQKNCIAMLAARSFRESFSEAERRFVTDVHLTKSDMHDRACSFLISLNKRYGEFKNPRLSKVHKFLRSLSSYSLHLFDEILILYKYAVDNNIDNYDNDLNDTQKKVYKNINVALLLLADRTNNG